MRDRSCQAPDPRGGGHGPSAPAWALHAPLALTFASGFTGLVYEVLWLKELGLLFGNT